MTGDLAMSKSGAVCVIGSGPGGLAAARTLASHGVRVDLIDENRRPGGAITRREFTASTGRDPVDVEELGTNVRFHAGSICHGFMDGRPVVSTNGDLVPLDPASTIIATGARERIRPIPGSLLRGVMACGAAQTLLKGSQTYPFRSAVVAGSGPLLLATASQLIDAGVKVRAVIEESGMLEGVSLATIWRLARSLPGNVAAEGARYVSNIVTHGAKLLSGYRVVGIEGDGCVQRVKVAQNGVMRAPRAIAVDSVVLSYGFVSASELVQQTGATMTYNKVLRQWQPERTGSFETSVSGLYTVGDCAGVQGKEVAELEGLLAAADVLRKSFDVSVSVNVVDRSQRRLRRLMLFQATMAKLFPQVALTDLDDDAIVCRCEGVTQGEVNEALDHGAADFRSVKLWTRLGMGICQGRTCHPVLADHLANVNDPAAALPKIQFPVRPLPFRVAQKL